MVALNESETMKAKRAKSWVALFGSISGLFLLLCALINALMDPLWLFTHDNSFNTRQYALNERQQKTNRITFSDFDYDALILGSSLVATINQNDFKGMKAFNYSSNSLKAEDYPGYIEYAKERAGKPFKYIILGLDFFGTNQYFQAVEKEPDYYILKAKQPLYRISSLLSLDTLKFSYKNYQMSQLDNTRYYYDRHNIKYLNTFSARVKHNEMIKLLQAYKDKTFAQYRYKNMLAIYQLIKLSNPDSQFIVFTPPISTRSFVFLMRLGLFQAYVQWLKDAVTVFGEVHHFMNINSLTNNMDKFQESIHIFPETGTLIADKITGHANPLIPDDFGVLLRRQNFVKEMDLTVEKLTKYQGP